MAFITNYCISIQKNNEKMQEISKIISTFVSLKTSTPNHLFNTFI